MILISKQAITGDTQRSTPCILQTFRRRDCAGQPPPSSGESFDIDLCAPGEVVSSAMLPNSYPRRMVAHEVTMTHWNPADDLESYI